jgi:hypothetical protein
VVHAAGEFVQAGLISGRQKDAIVTAAAHSSCGKHNRSGEEGEEDDREAEERRR